MEKKISNDYFETVSPSAKVLLFLKANTNLPYAKEAAELVLQNETPIEEGKKETFSYWARVAHMEQRYLSINSLITQEPTHNLLELSSGFSFRGLAYAFEKDVHYIDTDLPGVVETKKQLISELEKRPLRGKLEILPLNALDESEFHKLVKRFKPGPIAIVNEGLLMYLNREEKSKLVSIIRDVLKERGGYWVTADIYIRNEQANNALRIEDPFQRFLDAHQVEEKKFESEEDALDFFASLGFYVEKEAEPDYTTLSSFGKMIQHADPARLESLKNAGKIHTTWKLRLK